MGGLRTPGFVRSSSCMKKDIPQIRKFLRDALDTKGTRTDKRQYQAANRIQKPIH